MSITPETSTTLLRDIKDADSARWSEFLARYRPMMEVYLRECFPAVDADDAIQETLVALAKALPTYRYVPEETGHFHNYLTGILRHKAIRAAASSRRRENLARQLESECPHATASRKPFVTDEDEWRASLMEIALQQLLADETIHERTREVFRRVAVNGEKPEDVGHSFGIARNAVDQMKNRMMTRLKKLVRNLECVDG